jgi:hypothetical protein
MAKYRVSHPDPAFGGEIVGVVFADGAATVDTEQAGGHAAYAYFQRASYPTAPHEEPVADSSRPRAAGPSGKPRKTTEEDQ